MSIWVIINYVDRFVRIGREARRRSGWTKEEGLHLDFTPFFEHGAWCMHERTIWRRKRNSKTIDELYCFDCKQIIGTSSPKTSRKGKE